jgi:hypothetical protein
MKKHVERHYKKGLLTYRGLRKRHKGILWGLVASAIILAYPAYMGINKSIGSKGTATLYFVQPDSNLYTYDTFPLELWLDTKNQSTNAVGFALSYDPNMVEILNMTTDKSFCSFYADNSFDNIKGEVRISCGKPNPGFTGTSIMVRLNLRSKAPGNTLIKSDPDRTMVLANDGKGTNILNEPPSMALEIKNSF